MRVRGPETWCWSAGGAGRGARLPRWRGGVANSPVAAIRSLPGRCAAQGREFATLPPAGGHTGPRQAATAQQVARSGIRPFEHVRHNGLVRGRRPGRCCARRQGGAPRSPSALRGTLGASCLPLSLVRASARGWLYAQVGARLREKRASIARLKAGRSPGWRLVTQLPSSTTSRSTQLAPALRRSSWRVW